MHCRMSYSAFLLAKPGWDPLKHSDGVAVEETEDGLVVLKRVDQPPPSAMCRHQKSGQMDCSCIDASLPDGFNIPILNDKNREVNR